MNIIARKPTSDTQETIVVELRSHNFVHPYVVATASEHSLKHGEWYWGSYYKTRDEAMKDFNSR